MTLPFTDLVRSLPESVPFVGPETHERQRGAPFKARIGANESVFGPSPKTVEAMCAAAQDAWKYCDAENYELKQALAKHHGVTAENIIIGEGIDGLLGLTVRLFVDPGDAVITSAGAYPTFNYHVDGHGEPEAVDGVVDGGGVRRAFAAATDKQTLVDMVSGLGDRVTGMGT